ncbi:hypothetical protein FA95DRAFT_1208133 [Auriscalpium vulgare]|uniref:Uncharacterized protein n=1 Tax=Auriscalpium vulgare TaxID=40419 RepID=A0ACB8RUN5_9AGAM|nr:hypothetical protein FA95DRAFT_1208133 [Auriscalpium vulgare]
MIAERLEEIMSDAENVPEANEHGLGKFLQIVAQFARSLTMEDNDSDSDNGFDNSVDDEEYADELGRLKYEYHELEQERLEQNLAETVVDDPASLTSVLGQPRIELSLLPLIYVWLGRVHELVVRAQEEDLEEDEDFDPEQVLETMMVILWVFNARMCELTRVWRQQRMSVSQQIQNFCGGVFSAWYAESQKPDNILKKLATMVDGDDDDDEEDEDEQDKADSDSQNMKRLRGDVDQKLQEVWTRMNTRLDSLDTRLGALDGRLDNIESMLRALVGDGGSHADAPTKTTRERTWPSVPKALRRAQESEPDYGRQPQGSPRQAYPSPRQSPRGSHGGSPRQAYAGSREERGSYGFGQGYDDSGSPPRAYGRSQDSAPSYGRPPRSSPMSSRQPSNSASAQRNSYSYGQDEPPESDPEHEEEPEEEEEEDHSGYQNYAASRRRYV